ncbi:PaaI family thioesterase [Sansalvadorimonas sp. 2012CJ34-2]|uniref:PaaI family thioesterase n=1 Tax=Parendozoicomonas callyspongiae TaxID=2942213 RepID=A0ABT0PDM2_9GAMM|nr:PaaI family thioesterase [Sansalvadorimonas sp. 2012CJ34-2]MCL6268648.1 PaaI family thioesterase [Sansalvadorimonas sp. 2012CJ34-2]
MSRIIPDEQVLDTVAKQFLAALPHSVKLGMTIMEIDFSSVTVQLPWSEQIVGNPETGVVHSGVLTTLMDTACGICSICALANVEACPTLDLRIDHMKVPVSGKPLYATVEPYRVTKSIVFTRGTAWQESPDDPIAHAVGTFMRLGPLAAIKKDKSKSKQGEES